MSDWTVRLGDCLDPVTGLASLPDKSVDHVICDPPYSERVHLNSRRNNSRDGNPAEPGVIDFGFAHLDDATMLGAAVQFGRLARRWVMVFSADRHIDAWACALEAAGLRFVRTGLWVKIAPAPQFTGDRPGSGAEFIVVAHALGRTRWNGGGRPGTWEAGSIGKDHLRHHTAEKPLALMESLVRDFTDPGELICDPFAGSGTTGAAAKRLGRRFIGWERDEKYWRIATKRIDGAREQLRMFEALPSDSGSA